MFGNDRQEVARLRNNKGKNGFVYEVSVIHNDPKHEYGGFLSLEMHLCDYTDTCTQSIQVINNIDSEDLDEMISMLQKAKAFVQAREKKMEQLQAARRAMRETA